MKTQHSDLVREVTARYIGPRRKSPTITCASVAAGFVRSLLRDEGREHVIALYLDGAHKVVSYSLVSLGTANSAPMGPREVFKGALLVGAVALVIAHNHPSGEVSPSLNDKEVTKRLQEAGMLLGVQVLDHVIVSNDGYYSFAEHGG